MAMVLRPATRSALLAAGLAGIVVLALVARDCSSDAAPEQAAAARAFAATHYQRCLRDGPAPQPEVCALRTVQLASALHKQDFADLVAGEFR